MLGKLEARAVMRFLHLQGKSAIAIHAEMLSVYKEDCPSYDTVKRWKARFQTGHDSLEDEPKSGRPSIGDDAAIVGKVEALVLSDRRTTIATIMHELTLSHTTVWRILHDQLHLSKVSARWVPRLLTPFQKQRRAECAQTMLHLCQADETDFFDRLVTMDECWIYHYDPETKQMSMQWKHADSPPPKKAKTQPSSGKVMLSVFWDCRGVIMTDYLPKGQTITGAYYRNLLAQLREKIKERRRGMLSKGVRLLQDNAPAHTALDTVVLAQQCGYEILPHPPYSPDLAPSDFFLFHRLKKPLRGRRFSSDTEVISEVESFFSSQPEDFYNNGLRQVIHRWEKCVTLHGDYVEKD